MGLKDSIIENATSNSFVDRKDIIEKLDALADRVRKEQCPHFVFLYGEAGIGKTAIIQHFSRQQKSKKHDNNPCFINVESSEGNDLPLLPFVEGIHDFKRNNKNIARTALLFAANFIGFIPEVGPYVTGSINAFKTLRELSDMDRYQTDQHVMFSNYVEMLESISKNRMLILCVDDAHWLDKTSLNLLEYVSRNIKTGILFIISSRKTHADTRERHNLDTLDIIQEKLEERSSRVEIDSFSESHYGELIRCFSNTFETNSKEIHRIHSVTNGNPYWLCHALMCKTAETQIPTKLSRILKKRFEQVYLDISDSRTVLQYAAVLGYRFELGMLSKLVDMDKKDVFGILSEISQRYHLVENPAGESFAFDHKNTHDYVYDSLGPVLGDYHKTVAEFLENDHDIQDPYLLAYHYSHTECNEKMLQYMKAASTISMSSNFFADASERLRRCLTIANELHLKQSEITPMRIDYAHSLLEERDILSSMEVLENLVENEKTTSGEKAKIRILLSKCHRLRGVGKSGSEAIANAQSAVSIMKNTHSKQTGDAYAYLATVCDHFGNRSDTIHAYRMAIKYYQEDPIALAQLHRKSGMIMESRQAIDLMKHSLQIFEKHNMRIEQARCLNNIGAEYLYVGCFPESLSFLAKSLETFRILGTPEADIPMNNLGLYYLQNQKHAKAMQCFKDALVHSSETYNEMFIRMNISTVHRKKGELQKTIEILRELEEIILNYSEPVLNDYYGFNRGITHLEMGELDQAETWLHKFPINTYKNDQSLAYAKRMRAVSRIHKMQKDVSGATKLESDAQGIFDTRRPQRWFYMEDYYPCDIHIWD